MQLKIMTVVHPIVTLTSNRGDLIIKTIKGSITQKAITLMNKEHMIGMKRNFLEDIDTSTYGVTLLSQ